MSPKPVLRVVRRLETHEDVSEAIGAWVRGDSTTPWRSQTLECNSLGFICKLLEGGIVAATGRGRSEDEARANALEAL